MGNKKRRLGDRYDGRRIRTLDPINMLIPYVMRTRTSSQIYFEDKIEISGTEAFIIRKRKETGERIAFLHVIIAAMVRAISQKPALNRFIAGQKVYARNEILISFVMKKELNESSPETVLKIKFNPQDTFMDVVRKINQEISENQKTEIKNDADKFSKLIMSIPGQFIRFVVWLARFLDYMGLMPKIINRLSPFHTSVFITDLGSIGVQPVYHHLYDFGTNSNFIAFGIKMKEKAIDSDNQIVNKKYVKVCIVTDERIADGHFFATAFKLYRKLIKNPAVLDFPPESVVEDIE